MNAVVDVSSVAQILFQSAQKERFLTVLHEADLTLSPDLYVAELTNTVYKHHAKGIYTLAECADFVEDGLQCVDELVPSKTLWQEALAEGAKHSHSIYDMLYLVTARRYAAVLLTNDKTLLAICAKLGVQTA
ncbi:hypothetical protein AGMMS50229_09640 [Campylobacterota bacterium]|nr:hypothetical protein AGMMS50229_09640 [Campylobacterota bacterium]